ncbi:hypothetical protein V1514DRAFT_2364 [Lipomyces japonicus]|uniref:uncharacterized protein n=1 Tax=Lipomyces japonicus TaxID=56871 RepID=UPI0034CEE868
MDRKAQPFPAFDSSLPFSSLLYQIELHIAKTVDSPYSYDQLRGPPFSTHLVRPLVRSLDHTRHPAILAALLAARLDFAVQDDDRAVHEARAFTAELVASRYAAHLSEPELIELVTYEIPRKAAHASSATPTESTSLLQDHHDIDFDVERTAGLDAATSTTTTTNTTAVYVAESAIGLSALELAILGDAKKFLLSRAIENVINSIWDGRIVFWDSISIQSMKKPSFYNPNRRGHDWYSRLRVPKYRMFFMMINYVVLLALYYAVLVERNHARITALEILLDVWYAGFVYEEISQVRESGSIWYYASDYWSMFDLAMIFIFLIFFVIRLVSVMTIMGNRQPLADVAFDVLSLEALLLVPRVFSSLAVFPYFGTLLPCLKQMTKDFLKFLILIVILYVGFLTTFSFLGRDYFTVTDMAWLLIRVFFGAPYDGLDASSQISPIFGPTLMLVFVILTNVLLITVVISILSQRFGKMMNNANEEYMLLFASSVMESITTSDRVTYFYPPLNLIGILIRPLRLMLNHNEYRSLRITILKVTHAPFVAGLWCYESIKYKIAVARFKNLSGQSANSLSHLRISHGRNRLWPLQPSISHGLLLANQVIMSGTDPDNNTARTILSANGGSMIGSRPVPSRSASTASNSTRSNTSLSFTTRSRQASYGNPTGLADRPGVVRHRKTRKSVEIVAKTRPLSSSSSSPSSTTTKLRPPLASSVSSSTFTTPVAATNTSPSLTTKRSIKSPNSKRKTDNVKTKLAISVLRDLRRRRSVTLPSQQQQRQRHPSSPTSTASSNSTTTTTNNNNSTTRDRKSGKRTRVALSRSDFAEDASPAAEDITMHSLPARRHDDTGNLASLAHVAEQVLDGSSGHESEYQDDEDSEDAPEDDDQEEDEDDEEEEEEEEDNEDNDDDDEFLNLYADQTSVRMRGLEEQVFQMKQSLEQMNQLLKENILNR